MGENSKIEWCDHTFNPWIGCTKVSPGCDRCYAEAMMDHRYGRVKWGPHGARVQTSADYWKQPLRWAKAARSAQPAPRPRVFCASLCDVFDNQVPEEWRHSLFALIVATPELDWLLLTKRPENIAKMIDIHHAWPLPNVWLGFTAEDQQHFDRRWKIMREIQATVRFCSYEPAIGPLRLHHGTGFHHGLSWLICGGETGPGYREMDQDWEEAIRLDCAAAGIPYFFKQRSGKRPIDPGYPLIRQFPDGSCA